MNFGPKWIRQMYEEKPGETDTQSAPKPQLAKYRYGYEEMLMLLPPKATAIDVLVGQEIHVPEGREPAFQQTFQPSSAGDFSSRQTSFGSIRKNRRPDNNSNYERFNSDINPPFSSQEPPGTVKCEDLENQIERKPPAFVSSKSRPEGSDAFETLARGQLPVRTPASEERDIIHPNLETQQKSKSLKEPPDIRAPPVVEEKVSQSPPPEFIGPETHKKPTVASKPAEEDTLAVTTCEELEKILNGAPGPPVQKSSAPDFLSSQPTNFLGFPSQFTTTDNGLTDATQTFTLNLSKELSNFHKADNVFSLSDIESPDKDFLNGLLASPPKSSTVLDNFLTSNTIEQEHRPPEPITAPPPTPIAQQPSQYPPLPTDIPLPDEEVWMYIDPKGREQGPFTCSAMSRWYRNNFFPDTLPLRKVTESDYKSLTIYLEKYGDAPFNPGFLERQKREQEERMARNRRPQQHAVNGVIEPNNNFEDIQRKLAETVPSFNHKQEKMKMPVKVDIDEMVFDNQDDFLPVQSKRSPHKSATTKKEQKPGSTKQAKAGKTNAQEIDLKAMFGYGFQNQPSTSQTGSDSTISFKSMSLDENPPRPKPMATAQKSLPTSQNTTMMQITSAADLESNWFSNSTEAPSLAYSIPSVSSKDVPSLAEIQNEERKRLSKEQSKLEQQQEATRSSRPKPNATGSAWNVVHENTTPVDLAAFLGPPEPKKQQNHAKNYLSKVVEPSAAQANSVSSHRHGSAINGNSDLGMSLNTDMFRASEEKAPEVQGKKSQNQMQNTKKAKKEKQQQKSIKNLFMPNQVSAEDEFQGWCLDQIFTIEAIGDDIDIPTFVEMLKEFDSPYEVHDTVKQFLGDTKECQNFAKEFISRKAKLSQGNKKEVKANPIADTFAPVPPPELHRQQRNHTGFSATNNSTSSNNQMQTSHGSNTRPWHNQPPTNQMSLPQPDKTPPGKSEPPDGNKSGSKKGKQKKGQKINPASLLHISTQPSADRVKIGEIEKAG